MPEDSELVKALKEAGIEMGKPFKVERDPVIEKEVGEFLRIIQDAHEHAAKSNLRFRSYNLSQDYSPAYS
jgi:uncharacterized protein YqgV (UPF0045/DUF77 family)